MSARELPCLLSEPEADSARSFWNDVVAGSTTSEAQDKGFAVWSGDLPYEIFFEIPYAAEAKIRLIFNLIVDDSTWRPRKVFDLCKFDGLLIDLATRMKEAADDLAAPESIDRHRLASEIEDCSLRLLSAANKIDELNPNGAAGAWQPIPEGARVWGHAFGYRLAQ